MRGGCSPASTLCASRRASSRFPTPSICLRAPSRGDCPKTARPNDSRPIEHDYFRAHESGALDCIEPKGGTGPAWRFRSVEESAEARAFVDEQRDAAQIDPNDTPARRAVGRLLAALHLYAGYEIRSRGPLGCIMGAIGEIAPDIAERLSNGEDPGDLMHEIEGEES